MFSHVSSSPHDVLPVKLNVSSPLKGERLTSWPSFYTTSWLFRGSTLLFHMLVVYTSLCEHAGYTNYIQVLAVKFAATEDKAAVNALSKNKN